MRTGMNRRQERGVTVALLALMILPIMGAVGLAVDVGRLYAERQRAHSAAEAAAIAGAHEAARSGNTSLFEAAARKYASHFGFTDPSKIVGAAKTFSRTLPDGSLTTESGWEVQVTNPVKVNLIGPLLSAAPGGFVPVVEKVRVRLRKVPKGVHLLHATKVDSLLVERDSVVTFNTAVYVHSQDSEAVHIDHNSVVKTSYPIQIRGTGSYKVSGGATLSPTPIVNAPAQVDPFGTIAHPDPCNYPARSGTSANGERLVIEDGVVQPRAAGQQVVDGLMELPVHPDPVTFPPPQKAYRLCPGVYNDGITIKNSYVKFCSYDEVVTNPAQCGGCLAMGNPESDACHGTTTDSIFVIRGGGLKVQKGTGTTATLDASGGVMIFQVKHEGSDSNKWGTSQFEIGTKLTLNPLTSASNSDWIGMALFTQRHDNMNNDLELGTRALEGITGDVYVPYMRVKVLGKQSTPMAATIKASLIVSSLKFGGFVAGDDGDPVLVSSPVVGASGREIVLGE